MTDVFISRGLHLLLLKLLHENLIGFNGKKIWPEAPFLGLSAGNTRKTCATIMLFFVLMERSSPYLQFKKYFVITDGPRKRLPSGKFSLHASISPKNLELVTRRVYWAR